MSKLALDLPACEPHPHNEVFKIVLTGGPCAGKTTALARLGAFLGERGFRVFNVPEAATILFTSGVRFSDLPDGQFALEFQKRLMDIQLCLENSFEALARQTGFASVVLCDRGACDGKAYIDEAGWRKVLDHQGFDDDTPIREGRYNAVFHLVTAADGAEAFYTLANNEARSEPADVAVDVDRRTQSAWMGHPRHFIFDNSTDFEGKMQRVVDEMARIVGLPLSERSPTKFQLSFDPAVVPTTLPDPRVAASGGDGSASEEEPVDTLVEYLRQHLGGAPVRVFDVEKIYLSVSGPRITSDDQIGQRLMTTGRGKSLEQLPVPSPDELHLEYSFLRKRSQGRSASYGHTLVKTHRNGERLEIKRIINSKEYNWMKEMYSDPSRHVVRQRRYFFNFDCRTFSVHRYLKPHAHAGLCILHCQGQQTSSPRSTPPPQVFPPFLHIEKPVGDEGPLSAFHISLRDPSNADRAAAEAASAASLSSESIPAPFLF